MLEAYRTESIFIKDNEVLSDFCHRTKFFSTGLRLRYSGLEQLNNDYRTIPAQGIEVIVHEEAHTSKCSVLDMEPIEHHDTYAGKRISRGRFKSSDGTIINADVNGMYNIMRKAIEALGMEPRRLSI